MIGLGVRDGGMDFGEDEEVHGRLGSFISDGEVGKKGRKFGCT